MRGGKYHYTEPVASKAAPDGGQAAGEPAQSAATSPITAAGAVTAARSATAASAITAAGTVADGQHRDTAAGTVTKASTTIQIPTKEVQQHAG